MKTNVRNEDAIAGAMGWLDQLREDVRAEPVSHSGGEPATASGPPADATARPPLSIFSALAPAAVPTICATTGREREVLATIKPRERDRIRPRVTAAQAAPLAGTPASHWLTPAVEMAALVSDELAPRPDHASMRWACFPGICTPTPGGHGSRVGLARDFTASTLHQWGVSERCDDIAIVVSELVTNALQHAPPAPSRTGPGWPIQLGLFHPGHHIMCAVADASKEVPVPREPDFLDETGRGLQVIAALSDQWGCSASGDMGKVIWALFTT